MIESHLLGMARSADDEHIPVVASEVAAEPFGDDHVVARDKTLDSRDDVLAGDVDGDLLRLVLEVGEGIATTRVSASATASFMSEWKSMRSVSNVTSLR